MMVDIDKTTMTLNSSTTPSSSSSIDSVIKKQLEEDTWVQCDNIKCLKWRRISKTVADGLADTPWFCFMNSNQLYSSCADPQEDFKESLKIAKKCKLKYVASALSEGALVWAKMSGYCRWPGIVSKCPISESYMATDDDHHPISYHVEFLGEKHSRGWINFNHVDLYGSSTKGSKDSSVDTDSTQPNCSTSFETGQKPTWRRKNGNVSVVKKEVRTSYRGNSVTVAKTEADKLLDMLLHERLQYIIFRKATEAENRKADFSARMRRTKPQQRPQRCRLSSLLNGKTNLKPMHQNLHQDRNDCLSLTVSPMKSCSVETTSPLWLSTGSSITAKLNESASLQGRSKEEKFTIDVEMYRKNQDGFERDVSKFMRKQGLNLSRPPKWKDVPVTFFQLFLTVQEKGGYDEVCCNKQWSAVYREVTHFPIDSASIIRKFYRKNLLPYEHYTNGKDFQDLIREIKETFPHSVARPEKIQQENNTRKQENNKIIEPNKLGNKRKRQENNNRNYKKNKTIDRNKFQKKIRKLVKHKYVSAHKPQVFVIDSNCTNLPPVNEDMKIMFQQIDEDQFKDVPSTYDLLQDSIKKDSERLNLSLEFYNEPLKMTAPFTASMCGTAHLPEESARVNTSLLSSQICSPHSDNEDTLQKMQALQQELDAMNYQMIRQWE